MYWIFHVTCIVYCMYRLFKRANKTSLDGVIGVHPGIDMLFVVVLAPIFAIADIIATVIIKSNKGEKINLHD